MHTHSSSLHSLSCLPEAHNQESTCKQTTQLISWVIMVDVTPASHSPGGLWPAKICLDALQWGEPNWMDEVEVGTQSTCGHRT